jgi:hypothetical protein
VLMGPGYRARQTRCPLRLPRSPAADHRAGGFPVSAYDRLVHALSIVLLVVGAGIALVGLLGFLERLPRNRFGGVRTPASMRSDRAFRVANKVGGLPIAVAGGIGALCGLVTVLTGLAVVLIVGFAGMVAITIAGGIVGHRAAETVPADKPALPEGCKGCQCGGCDLAAAIKKDSVGADVSGMRRE